MLDAVREAIAANQLEAAGYPKGVQVWMMVMGIAFLSAIVFAPWKQGARWILFAAVINIAGLIFVKTAWPDLSRTEIGTGLHFIFWVPVLFMVWRPSARMIRNTGQADPINAVYKFWLAGVSAIMAFSLVLDARKAIGWLK